MQLTMFLWPARVCLSQQANVSFNKLAELPKSGFGIYAIFF